MTTEGMKVINDYVKPSLDKNAQNSINSLKQHNQELYSKVDDYHA